MLPFARQDEIHAPYPVLPDKIQRSHVISLVTELARPLGLGQSVLVSLIAMIESTRPSDWKSPNVEPYCHKYQNALARRLGIEPRTLRRHEARLIGLGLIEKKCDGRGNRHHVRIEGRQDLRQGICFSPLIERVPDLIVLRDRIRLDAQIYTAKKLQISAMKREVRELLEELMVRSTPLPALMDLSRRTYAWPRRYEVFRTLKEITAHFDEVWSTLSELRDLMLMQQKMSGSADIHVPPIQAISKAKRKCSAPTQIRTSSDEPYIACAEPASDEACNLQRKNDRERLAKRNAKLSDLLVPHHLYRLATPEMQALIDKYQGNRPRFTETDFIMAAYDRLAPLGIHPSVFTEASNIMGDPTTTICILIIDNNRNHPTKPIHSPGGVLRAMTRLFKAGELNLIGSLIGLSERVRCRRTEAKRKNIGCNSCYRWDCQCLG